MARIPDQVIKRLKQEVSLVALMERQGHRFKPHGKDRVTRCPFHEDDTPSLVVSPDTNLWHCLGACQAGGSVIDWVMKTEGVSFRHAVEALRQDPSVFSRMEAPVKQATARKLPPLADPGSEDGELMKRVIAFYHQSLKDSPEALAYLERRGLNDAELIETFCLGFANRTLGYRLPKRNRKVGGEIRGRLESLGVLRATGNEHFLGSLVIPVIDGAGQVREVYGRKIRDNVRQGTPLHLYLPGPHQGVFNEAGLKGQAEVILCESQIDALTFWAAGFKNVTSAYGTAGFTAEMLGTFQDLGIERVLIAFDRDGAGEAAAEKVAKKLSKAGIDSYRLHFPKGMDANEYALKVGPPNKSLGLVVRKAVFLGKGEGRPDPRPEPELASVVEPTPHLAASGILPDAAPAHPSATAPCVALPPASMQSCAMAAKEESVEHGEAVGEKVEEPPALALPRSAHEIAAEISEREVAIALGDRHYRVRGLEKNLSYEQLKVTVLAGRGDELHVDTLDLYHAKMRAAFIRQAGIELGVEEGAIKRDLGQVLMKLEQLQAEQIEAALKPKTPAPALSPEDERQALELLQSPDLLDRLVEDLSACGLVGEAVNKQVAYLAAVSRKLTMPLAIIVQSTSAAGKSALMDAVLALAPEEDRVHYSAMTGQSLFYMGGRDLKHKILGIAEEEGVQQASYALKLLQSQGELTIASTGKDPNTGKLVTEEYRVEGPVMLFLTTTAVDIDEELLNRCLVLSVDESRQQTRLIHQQQRQRRTLAGLKSKCQREKLTRLHANAQRLLRPLEVLNPYAEQLTFVDDRTRTRRDHEKYLTLIDAIALLHQHQRSIQTTTWQGESIEYVEVTLEDIERANHLAHEVLGRSLDELPPQTRRLLGKITDHVASECARQGIERGDLRFSRRELRQVAGLSDTQLRVHLERLVELEYLLVHRGRRGCSYVYELLFDGDLHTPSPQLMGLIQPDLLRQADRMNGTSRGSEGDLAGSTRAQNGAIAVGSRGEENPEKPHHNKLNGQSHATPAENPHPGVSGDPTRDVIAP